MGCCGSDDLKVVVKQRYGNIAASGSTGCSCGCSTGSDPDFSTFNDSYAGIEGYVAEADLSLGCGLPTEYAGIKFRNTVVDLGSGAGNDCFIAQQMVGPDGEVIGIDMTPEMIFRAQSNTDKLNLTNVKFRLGEIENIPVDDNHADVVISNCVINLVPDKNKAFQEIYRILKPGGHFCISDVVTEGAIPPQLLEQAELYAGCVAGALQVEDYVAVIRNTGFSGILIRTKKKIDVPEALLNEFLSDDEVQAFRDSGVGIFSITITADKPL